MVHKGGKKARAAFHKAHNVPVHLKESIEDLKPAQLMALLRFLLIFIQATRGSKRLSKAQRKSLAITERQLGVRLSGSRHGSGRRHSGRRRRLRPGVHMVRLGKMGMRKVRVLSSGKWQFI